MSYDFYMIRQQNGMDFHAAMDLLEQVESDRSVAESVAAGFFLDKRQLADDLLASPLRLDENASSNLLDIELYSPEDAEPPITILCSDYSVSASMPYWEPHPKRLAAMKLAWNVMLDLCERHGLVLYDPQLEDRVTRDGLEEVEKAFGYGRGILEEATGIKAKPPWWKFW